MSALQSCRNEIYGDTSQLFCPPSSIATYWIPTKCKWNQIILTLVTALTWYEKSIAGRAKVGVRLQTQVAGVAWAGVGVEVWVATGRCLGWWGQAVGQWTLVEAAWLRDLTQWSADSRLYCTTASHRHGYTLLRSAQCLTQNKASSSIECAHCSDS